MHTQLPNGFPTGFCQKEKKKKWEGKQVDEVVVQGSLNFHHMIFNEGAESGCSKKMLT
jgi:hypothetical protein